MALDRARRWRGANGIPAKRKGDAMADANQPLKPGDVVLHNGLKWTLIARVVVPEVPPRNSDLPDAQQTGDLISRFAVCVGGQNVSPPDAQPVGHGAALGRYPEAFAWCCCRLKHKMERLMVRFAFIGCPPKATGVTANYIHPPKRIIPYLQKGHDCRFRRSDLRFLGDLFDRRRPADGRLVARRQYPSHAALAINDLLVHKSARTGSC